MIKTCLREKIRNTITKTVFELIAKEDNTILEFKLEILRELAKTLRQLSSHNKIDSSLLDCLVTHKIIVDEEKAKVIDESSRKVT